MARAEPRLTYEDYLHFPDDQRWELIDGRAYVVPSPNRRHQEILGELHVRVHAFLDRHGGGKVLFAPFDVLLSDSDVVQPDLVFFSDDDLDRLGDRFASGPPTWAVEVLSDARRDRRLKRQRYETFGVPEYWIIDPGAETIEVFVLDDGRYREPSVFRTGELISPRCLRGLDLDPGAVFPEA